MTNKLDSNSFGYALRMLRLKFGLSMKDVANGTSIGEAAIGAWERGAMPIRRNLKIYLDYFRATDADGAAAIEKQYDEIKFNSLKNN